MLGKKLSIANDNRLVSGYEDSSFKPDNKISREETMAVIAKAMRLAGIESGINDAEATEILDRFSDSGNVSRWAKLAVAECIEAGIVSGSNGRLNPQNNISQAEVAILIKKLLQEAGLI